MEPQDSVSEFVLPDAPMIVEQEGPISQTSPYKSPTKRITSVFCCASNRVFRERLHGVSAPPESPDMKFARNRLGNLLTSIRKGDAPPVAPEKPP